MFDYINFKMDCPNCGKLLSRFQSKDLECTLGTVEPDSVSNFYDFCDCGNWVEFNRPPLLPSSPLRETPLTLEQVKALGFEMTVTQLERHETKTK